MYIYVYTRIYIHIDKCRNRRDWSRLSKDIRAHSNIVPGVHTPHALVELLSCIRLTE